MRIRTSSSFTIVETMLAVVIILLIVIGGGMFLYLGTFNIEKGRNIRVALEAANSRLEEIKTAKYSDISPAPADDWDIHYLDRITGNWRVSDSDGPDPQETVLINAETMPIATTVQYVDEDVVADPGAPLNSHDYMKVSVSVGYRANPDERITIETYIKDKS